VRPSRPDKSLGLIARRVCVGVLFMLGALGLPTPSALADTPVCQVVIGSCHRPPLSNATGTGILDRLVVEAFRRVGVAACIEPSTCERSLRNADAGVTDGDILRIPTAIASSFPKLVAVPEVLYALPMSGFTARPDLRVERMDELASLRVGYILGWRILEERVHAATVLRVRGMDELFPLLLEKKADLVIYERLTGLHHIETLGLADIRALDPPLLVTPQHLILNPRLRHLAQPLATALRAIKADGSYAAAFRTVGHPVPTAP